MQVDPNRRETEGLSRIPHPFNKSHGEAFCVHRECAKYRPKATCIQTL